MEKPIPADIGTAVLVSNIAADLCKDAGSGIIFVSPIGVQLSDFLFHQTFNTWTVEPCIVYDDMVYHVHKIGGVRVFCMTTPDREEAEE